MDDTIKISIFFSFLLNIPLLIIFINNIFANIIAYVWSLFILFLILNVYIDMKKDIDKIKKDVNNLK